MHSCETEVQKITIEAGDKILVKWSPLPLDDGQGPWVPGPEDLATVKKDLEEAFPEATVILIGPHVYDLTVVG